APRCRRPQADQESCDNPAVRVSREPGRELRSRTNFLPTGRFPLATRSRPTRQKHDRERAKQQKQKDKAARRPSAKATPRPSRPSNGEDPDIAGIVPGPQPKPWDDEDAEENEENEN